MDYYLLHVQNQKKKADFFCFVDKCCTFARVNSVHVFRKDAKEGQATIEYYLKGL